MKVKPPAIRRSARPIGHSGAFSPAFGVSCGSTFIVGTVVGAFVEEVVVSGSANGSDVSIGLIVIIGVGVGVCVVGVGVVGSVGGVVLGRMLIVTSAVSKSSIQHMLIFTLIIQSILECCNQLKSLYSQ